jgi:surface protein
MVIVGKSSLKALPRVRRFLLDRRLETGFSMLEAVVVVGVLLALAIAGFFAYGAITQNAKKAAIKDAADKVHTAVLVADTDGNANTKPEDVIDGWNVSTDQTFVELLKDSSGKVKRANGDFCVEATNLPARDVKQRAGSCDDALPGAGGDNGGNNGGGTAPIVDTSAVMRSTWNTSLEGCSILTLPLTGNVDATINWGDGVIEPYTRSGASNLGYFETLPSHQYSTSGPTEITITGTFDGWQGWDWSDYSNWPTVVHADNTWSKNCITDVNSWGDATNTQSLSGGFFESSSIKSVARIPSTVNDLGDIFNSSNFNGDVSGWDTSNVTYMGSAFAYSPFSGDISKWNTSQVTSMSSMFQSASNFNSNISNWNVSNVNNMYSMFKDTKAFNTDVSGWNVSKVISMGYDFYYQDFNANSILTNDHIPAAFRPITEVTFTPLTSSNASQTIVDAMNARLSYLADPEHLAGVIRSVQTGGNDNSLYWAWSGYQNPSQVRKNFEATYDKMFINMGDYLTYDALMSRTDAGIASMVQNDENYYNYTFLNSPDIKKQQTYVDKVRATYQAALDAPHMDPITEVASSVSFTPTPASAGTTSQVNWANAKQGYLASKYNLYYTWANKNGHNAMASDMWRKLRYSAEGEAYQTYVVDTGMESYDQTLGNYAPAPEDQNAMFDASGRVSNAYFDWTFYKYTLTDLIQTQKDYVKANSDYYPLAFKSANR